MSKECHDQAPPPSDAVINGVVGAPLRRAAISASICILIASVLPIWRMDAHRMDFLGADTGFGVALVFYWDLREQGSAVAIDKLSCNAGSACASVAFGLIVGFFVFCIGAQRRILDRQKAARTSHGSIGQPPRRL
jgi:hypothetical protein